MRHFPALPLAFGLLLLCCRIGGAGQVGSNRMDLLQDPAYIRYAERLAALRRNRPVDEWVSVTGEGSFRLRRVVLWLKASPPVPESGGVRRRLTLYLDDTAGNRLRTVPDDVKFQTAPPAHLEAEGEQKTENGEVSNELWLAPGQQSAALSAVPLPIADGSPIRAQIPAAPPPSALFLASSDAPVRASSPQPVDPAVLAQLLKDARDLAAHGRWFNAESAAESRARALLQAGDRAEALEAFRLGAREFHSPVCAWAEVQFLRLSGDSKTAKKRAAELLEAYPKSVPAQFLNPEPGEQWWTPYNCYFFPPKVEPADHAARASSTTCKRAGSGRVSSRCASRSASSIGS